MKKIYKITLLLALIFFSGCSQDETKQSNNASETPIPINSSVKLISNTNLKVGDSSLRVTEVCVNEELIIYIYSFKAAGPVKAKDNSKCVNQKKEIK